MDWDVYDEQLKKSYLLRHAEEERRKKDRMFREMRDALEEAARTLEGCRYSEQPMAKKLRSLLAEVDGSYK